MAWEQLPIGVGTEASPDGFDVVQYNSLTTTNASADMLMNRLVDYDAAAGQLVPSLAERWETPDPTTCIFTLREGVRFSDGRPLTARDVAASLNAVRERAWVTRDLLAAVISVRADGPRKRISGLR